MHGTTMVFLVGMPIVAGLSNYLVPLMIGARDMAFPAAERLWFLDLPVRRHSPLLQLSGRRRVERRRFRARCGLVRVRALNGEGFFARGQAPIIGRLAF